VASELSTVTDRYVPGCGPRQQCSPCCTNRTLRSSADAAFALRTESLRFLGVCCGDEVNKTLELFLTVELLDRSLAYAFAICVSGRIICPVENRKMTGLDIQSANRIGGEKFPIIQRHIPGAGTLRSGLISLRSSL
jgi:hypothetical protein